MPTTTTASEKAAASAIDQRAAMLAGLAGWIRQRPGLDYSNYGEPRSYRAELRGIARAKRDAEILLSSVSWRTSITAAHLTEATRAFSGRLTWDGKSWNYTAGQYWPTEYRAAACAVLASALWAYWRANLSAAEIEKAGNAGAALRAKARAAFGRGLQSRWFH